MKLRYRESEITLLRRQQWMATEQRSRMTVVSGKSRTGKTSAIVEALGNVPFLYFRSSGMPEPLLLKEYIRQIAQNTEISLPKDLEAQPELLRNLFDASKNKPVTIVMDSFQQMIRKDPDYPQMLGKLWKTARNRTHMHLILITEDEAFNREIFDSPTSPMQNLPDARIEMKPFSISELRACLSETNPRFTPEDLLALYMTTGGTPPLVLSMLHKAATKEDILRRFTDPDAPFIREGELLLKSALGKSADIYMAILMLIASGCRSQAEIEAKIGSGTVGGHLAKLEKEYGLILKTRPILAGKSSRYVVRFEIADMFLAFWLRTFEAKRMNLEMGDYDSLYTWARNDFDAYSKTALKRYFVQKFKEESGADTIGGEWKSNGTEEIRTFSERKKKYFYKGVQSPKASDSRKKEDSGAEIDIMILDDALKKALIAAVEPYAEAFDKKPFLKTIDSLKQGPLKGFETDNRLFTLEDM